MLNFRYRIKDNADDLAVLMETARRIWNYALMLQRKSREWYGKRLSIVQLRSYVAKKRNKNKHWQKLNSQSVQEICERIEVSYERCRLKLQKRPPKFKSNGTDMSFCFLQCGYSIDNDRITITDPSNRKVPIGTYRFLKHRAYPMDKVRQVRIKRYNNHFYIIITCDCSPKQLARTCNGTVGIDFGLKTFITLDDGEKIESPRWLFKGSKKLRLLDRQKDRKVKGSNNRRKAAITRANAHAKIAQKREDWHWKLAHQLCKQYAIIKIEDLRLTGMQRLWGRKVSDIAIGEFVNKLIHVASKYGTQVIKVDRFFASSHICHKCGTHVGRKLGLMEREWQCPVCGVAHDRDVNAAINIKCWEPACDSENPGNGKKRSKTKVAIQWQRRDTNKKPYVLT